MLRVLKSTDTKIDKRLNGTYQLVYFGVTNLTAGSGENILFFKFDKEVKTELVGNDYFTADGYVYDICNNMTSNFTYRPQITSEVQKLQFKNAKNINVTFFDKNENVITLPNWIMILKQM